MKGCVFSHTGVQKKTQGDALFGGSSGIIRRYFGMLDSQIALFTTGMTFGCFVIAADLAC